MPRRGRSQVANVCALDFDEIIAAPIGHLSDSMDTCCGCRDDRPPCASRRCRLPMSCGQRMAGRA